MRIQLGWILGKYINEFQQKFIIIFTDLMKHMRHQGEYMMKAEFVKPELSVEELSIALYQANRKLEQTNKELLHSRQELTEVFVNISHDLRSPVTAIRNSVEYLLSQEELDSKEVLHILQLVNRRVNYLEQLISDVFLLSSIDSSKKILKFETVNIGMFLEDFFFGCEADKKYANRRLILTVSEDFGYMVSIDCKLMVRVMDNLFTNALKYSMEDSSIILSAIHSEEEVIISIEDTGFGIAEEHQTKIFDRTYMVSTSRTPGQMSGCGLGLAISKAIVENHGGRIWCESEPGTGSIFSFTLPIIRN
jgi:signal transduction histidine kinase